MGAVMRNPFASLLLVCASFLVAAASWAECEGIASAPPADTPPGVRVVQYSSTPVKAGLQIVAQENCFLILNGSNDVQQVTSDLFLSQQGGIPGPWFIDPSQNRVIDLADGASASCSIPSPGRVRVAPQTGFLLAGTVSDACCFTWFSTNGTCEGLPLAGNQVEVQASVGASVFGDVLTLDIPGIPSGGSTCGLLGIEALLVLPFCARRRRARASGGRS